MTKREMIDEILLLNKSAEPEFLAQFEIEELDEYLHHLQMIRKPRLSCTVGQFDKYFENIPAIPSGKANPAATIVSDHHEDEIWTHDPFDQQDPPVEQMLFDDNDDQLEEVSPEHVNIFSQQAATVSQGHKTGEN